MIDHHLRIQVTLHLEKWKDIDHGKIIRGIKSLEEEVSYIEGTTYPYLTMTFMIPQHVDLKRFLDKCEITLNHLLNQKENKNV